MTALICPYGKSPLCTPKTSESKVTMIHQVLPRGPSLCFVRTWQFFLLVLEMFLCNSKFFHMDNQCCHHFGVLVYGPIMLTYLILHQSLHNLCVSQPSTTQIIILSGSLELLTQKRLRGCPVILWIQNSIPILKCQNDDRIGMENFLYVNQRQGRTKWRNCRLTPKTPGYQLGYYRYECLAAMNLLNLLTYLFFSGTSNELNAVSKPPCLSFVATVNFECMHFLLQSIQLFKKFTIF